MRSAEILQASDAELRETILDIEGELHKRLLSAVQDNAQVSIEGPLEFVVLNPKLTHEHRPECPSRLAKHPNGTHWYCVDCGVAILSTRLRALELADEEPKCTQASEKSDGSANITSGEPSPLTSSPEGT